MKKAMLVTLSITTRVVVEGENIEDCKDAAVCTAVDKIYHNPKEYIIGENLENVCEDNECPYGTFEGEN